MDKKLIVAAVVAGLLVHHAFFFYGPFGFDDMTYAELAYNLLHGKFDAAHPFSYRIVLVSLLSLSYGIFGVTEWASTIPSLLASTCIVVSFYWLSRDRPTWILGLALASYFGMKWNLFYSDKIMADILVSAASFGAWVAYMKYRTDSRPALKMAIAAGILLFIGFNAKGTLILLCPLYLFYFIRDLLNRRGGAFWLPFALTCALLLTTYFITCAVATGSALSRFAAIDGAHYLNPCSYDILPREVLMRRLTLEFWEIITDSGKLPHAIFALFSLGVFAYRKKLGDEAIIYPLTTIVCLLSINFMTISIDSYNPVCRDPRHILLFAPIIASCSALSLAAVCRLLGIDTNSRWFYLAIVALCLLLFYPAGKLALYNRTLEYPRVKARYAEVVAKLPRPSVVYGSEVTRTLNRYYLGFEGEKQGLRYLNVEVLEDCSIVSQDSSRYLLQTWYADWHAEMSSIEFETTVSNRGWQRGDSGIDVEGIVFEKLSCAE